MNIVEQKMRGTPMGDNLISGGDIVLQSAKLDDLEDVIASVTLSKTDLDKILDCISLSSTQGLNNTVLPQITSTSGL